MSNPFLRSSKLGVVANANPPLPLDFLFQELPCLLAPNDELQDALHPAQCTAKYFNSLPILLGSQKISNLNGPLKTIHESHFLLHSGGQERLASSYIYMSAYNLNTHWTSLLFILTKLFYFFHCAQCNFLSTIIAPKSRDRNLYITILLLCTVPNRHWQSSNRSNIHARSSGTPLVKAARLSRTGGW